MSDFNFKETSALFGTNSVFMEEIYEHYLQNPSNVDESWQAFFKEMGDSLSVLEQDNQGASWAPRKTKVVGAKPELEKAAAPKNASASKADLQKACRDSINALMLIRAYKVRGNLLADLDPLGLEGQRSHPDLDPTTYGFTDDDYDHPIFLNGNMGLESATLRELIALLKSTYASRIGVEFMHIPALEQRDWIASRIEHIKGRPTLTDNEKRTLLEDIVKVELFEQFLHKKFPGAKRFSAEGGEAVFASMEKMIETAAAHGVREVVIGMPHRGRLNVLTKVMDRRYASMLAEFQGKQAHISEDIDASGDVKYHQGASSDRDFDGNKIHLSLSANPSHLEAVNPVVVGRVRAKQDQFEDTKRRQVMGLLMHGDASFAGQGVVQETLALSDLDGYTTGGTVHVIVNNQIGFTTSPRNARKSPYPTDVAKGSHAPIFHVNGDDPEAVAFVSKLAVEFRQEFGVDVVVDVFCYRRYGHNEGDEPFFTQPIMYERIKNHPTPMAVYAKRLIDEGTVSKDDFEQMKQQFNGFLEEEYKIAQDYGSDEADWLKGSWEGLKKAQRGVKKSVDTGVDADVLKELGHKLATYPEDFNIHRKLVKQLNAKKEMVDSGEGIDWAMGEGLAYASLLAEGVPVRLSGQDCERGTFSHRHSVLNDQKDESTFTPLNHVSEEQAYYEVINSNLSEFAVLGFEYGYSLAEPKALVLWEAQFGDFANEAQVIFDQFISSSEIKWLRFSGITCLLPHGYEGQGPEHSSARLERFLQLCAEDNMQVVNCTTPANFFHALRRQVKHDFRKPLIVMTPKSLLRHKKCVSHLNELTTGSSFNLIIGETEKLVADSKVRKVVICSGKVYYDLLEARKEKGINDVALIRLEQYYPYPEELLANKLKRYKNADVAWCQEEPKNMGAWVFLDRRLEASIEKANIKARRPSYAGRKATASPAAGYAKIHHKEQAALIDEALS